MLLVLFLADWRIGLVNAGLAIVVTMTVWGFRNTVTPRWARVRQASAAQIGFLEESLMGAEDIRARGANAYAMQRFYHVSRELLHSLRTAWLIFVFTLAVTALAVEMGGDLGLAVGIRLFQMNDIDLGTVYVIMYYMTMAMTAVEEVTRGAQNLQTASASIARIQALLRTQSSIKEGHGVPLAPGALSVEFRSVSFEYVNSESVLHDVSFRLQAGQVLGLLGRTGSGKTTLTRLLFRLYDPTAGAICLNEVSVQEMRLAELRQRIGMVTQEVQLFQASLRDNLTLFNRNISDDRIRQALRELGLWEWCQALPAGLETRLGPDGVGLSAGEEQMLAFARVFLRDPGLIILDEASSRLDPLTEQRLERAVERLLQNRTGIIIAHRLATIQRTDEVMILEGGRICEYGPRVGLARDPHSRYSHLLRTGLEEVLP